METTALLLFFGTFFMLLFGHCLADFPLQGDFLSNTKDPNKNYIEVWLPALFAHSVIHAGMVFIITGFYSLAILQFVTHFIIDYVKCHGWFGSSHKSFLIDQMLHYSIMIITATIFVVLTI